jgi:amidophosphoribosyltransferase
VVVDDSIVRGTTSRKIVEILREAGAAEIHMRVSSPPIKCPCFYGIDTANRTELIASRLEVPQIGEFLNADSIHYLSLDKLVLSCGGRRNRFCTACFEGDYMIDVPDDIKMSKFRLEGTRA